MARGVPKGFRAKKGDIPISKCSPGSIRTKILSKTKRLTVCCPRGGFKHGRCRVGMRAAKILVKTK
jgi:hypothetical protein